MEFKLGYFCIALTVGILYVYLTVPKTKVIMKTPTPDNSNSLLYVDNNNVCYRYKAEEVQCPTNDLDKVTEY